MAGNEKFNRLAVNHKTIQTLTLPPMPVFDRALIAKNQYLVPFFEKYEQEMRKWVEQVNYVLNQTLVPIKHLQQQIEDSSTSTVTETVVQVPTSSSGSSSSTPSSPGIQLGDTVVSETSFGQSPSAGSSSMASRADHTHGTPNTPVTAAADDPIPYAIALG